MSTPVTVRGRTFAAPGPGAWVLDAIHMPRALTRYLAEIMPAGYARGFAAGTATYGSMLSHFEPRVIHGMWYNRHVIVGAPAGATGTPPKLVVQLSTRLSPLLRKRLAAGRRAFETKAWREVLRRWDDDAKPRATREHLRLQAIDPARLGAPELVAHLAEVRDQLERMWEQHMEFTATAAVPVGDFLWHARTWTGIPFGDLLQAFRGTSAISRGVAAVELDVAGEAVREDARAREILGGADPTDVLARLRALEGAAGDAVRDWIDVAGTRSLGYDVCEPYALELPGVLVDSLRAAVASGAVDRVARDAQARASAEMRIRERVPERHRAEFDDILAEARLLFRLRDERGNYSDAWATGLARRAVLAAGARLHAAGAIDDPALAIDATHGELVSMLGGGPGPSSDELREHAHWRTSVTAADCPPWLGAPPSPPPPAEWLAPAGRRTARAIDAYLEAMYLEPEVMPQDRMLAGLAVSPGTYEGPARIVRDSSEFARIRKGDVLVTRATSATFNVVLPLLGAVVTDHGGQLCHAAIVAREHGIPGVVGTREATKRLADGVRVRVDGTKGLVTVLA